MINQSRRRFGAALVLVILLTAALAETTTLGQTLGGATVVTGEAPAQEDPWSQLGGLPVGTRVRLTLRDGAEIEGQILESRGDALVLQESRVRKGQFRTDAGASLSQALTFRRADVAAIRAPAWAQSAFHRRMGDGFVYDVVDVGVGKVSSGLRRVRSSTRSWLAFRSSTGFWLALRITNLSPSQSMTPHHPSFLVAVDDAKNEYSVWRETVQFVESSV